MKKAILIQFIPTALLICSCGGGLLTDMSRTLADPAIAVPTVTSFVSENRIDVSWSSDPGADRYMLERALDAVTPVFTIVYEGTNTNYSDAGCADQARLLYRLTKERGSRSFGPSDVTLGIASAVCHDAQEPDDTESQAALLESTLQANLFYYTTNFQQHNAPLVEQDADWYAVDVPANSTANIVVTQNFPALPQGTVNAWMFFYLKGQFENEVINSQLIPVANYSNAKTTFFFKIRPNQVKFPANGGGTLVNYDVKLYNIQGN